MVVQNGQKLTGAELARGLLIFLNRSINPSSATTAACSVTLEVPVVVNGLTSYYQPVVLAATVGVINPGVITWNPVLGAQQYLLNQLPSQIVSASPFASDWDVLPAATPAGTWTYVPGGVQVNLPANSAGVTAISHQTLQSGVGTLTMSFTPANTPDQAFSVGLIFNYSSPDDYWEFSFYKGSKAYSGGGYSIMQASITHYQSGTTTTQVMDVGVPGVIPTIASAKLTITQSTQFSATLAYGAVGSSAISSYPISLPASPPTLTSGLGVGLSTSWPGTSHFTQLVMNPVSGASQDFLQPSSLTIIGCLQVKRDFLQAAAASGGPTTTGSQPRSPLSDFSMWFWLLLSVRGYGATGFRRGIGLNQVLDSGGPG